MIDRRSLCVGAAVGAFAAHSEVAGAMPEGRLSHSDEALVFVQQPPPVRPPSREQLANPKAFEEYLAESAFQRLDQAGIAVDDAKPSILEVIQRSAEAAFRPQKGEIRRGETLDALPIEVRRVIVVRNFNTFVDVLIVVGWNEGKRLTKEAVNRVRGFLCPLYPICTG